VIRFDCKAENQIEEQAREHAREEKRLITRKTRPKLMGSLEGVIRTLWPEAKRILCIGCRDESEPRWFVDRKWQAEGIDVAVRTHGLLRKMDAHEIADFYKPNEFDLVYASHSLEHMHDANRALRGIRRVSSQGLLAVLPTTKSGTKASMQHPSIFDIMLQPNDDHKTWIKDFAPLDSFRMVYHEVMSAEVVVGFAWP
jgi:SAM-dependent methyltransferase